MSSISPAFEDLYIRIKSDSSLERDFDRDTKAAKKFEKGLTGIFSKFKDQTVTVDFEEHGAAKTRAAAESVDEALDNIDGRNVSFSIDQRGVAGLRSLSGGFSELAGNIKNTGAVLQASKIPFQIAAIGGAVPTVAALASSVGGLAMELGRAGAGLALIGGAAAGGAVAGLKAYTAGISATVTASREAYLALHEQRAEQLELRRQTILDTAASREFNVEIDRASINLTKLQAEIGNRVFPAFTRELRAWGGLLNQNQGEIVDTAGAVADVATEFSKWLRNSEAFGRTFSFINSSAVKGAQALSNLGKVGIMGIQPLIPLASDLQSKVLGLTRETANWVRSTEGQARLAGIYRRLDAEMRATGQTLWSFVRGFFQLGTAIDQSGLDDQASRGLAKLASGFERATTEGTSARRTLDAFLTNARKLMPFAGSAVMAFVHQIGRVSRELISARTQGHKLTILQETFQGLEQAARPLGNLLISTFEALGPEIPKLVTNAAKLAEVFAGSTGPLVQYVRLLNRGLEIFTSLPKPVQTFVANLAGLKLVLGTLGVSAVVGPMGRFASNMFIANRAAAQLAGKSALAGVVGSLGKLSLLLAGGIGIAALGAALFVAYQKNEDFRESVNKLATTAAEAFSGVASKVENKLLPALANVATKAANVLSDIFDTKDPADFKAPKKYGEKSGGAFIMAMKEEIRREAANQADEGSPAYELGFKAMGGVERGARAYVNQKAGSFQIDWAKLFGLGGGGKGGGNFFTNLPIFIPQKWINKQVQQGIIEPFKAKWQAGWKNVDWMGLIRDVFTGRLLFGQPVDWAEKQIGPVIEAVKAKWRSLPAWVRSFSSSIVRPFVAPFKIIADILVGNSIVPEMVNDIVGVVKGLPGRIMAVLRALPGQLVSFWKDRIWQPMATFVSEKASGIMQTLSNWKGKAVSWVSSLVGAILNFWRDRIWQPIATFVVDKTRGISQTLTNWKTRAVSWVKSLPRAIGSLWTKLWQGMADWVVEKKEGILNTISNLKSGIVGGFTAIVGFINKVLNAVGLPTINLGGGGGGPTSNGPTSPLSAGGTGPAMRDFAKGGRVEARRGGVYRVAEAGQDEWVINPSRPDNVRHLRDAAAEMGHRVVPLGGHRQGPVHMPPGREGRDWFGQGGGGGGSWPPKAAKFRHTGGDNVVDYSFSKYSTGPSASLVAAGAALWNGLVKAGGNDVSVATTDKEVRMGNRIVNALTYSDGSILLGPRSDKFTATHEFGHTLGLDHGGNGIMGGMGRTIGGPSQGDFDAIAAYYGSSTTGGGSGSGGFSAPGGYTLPQLLGSGAIRPWTQAVLDVVRAVTWKAGGNPSSYATHPGGAAHSADWWGMGGRGDAIDPSTGQKVHDTLLGSFGDKLNWIIWEGMIQDATGRYPYNDPSDRHFDHVHGTILAPGRSVIGGGQASLWDTIGNALWNWIVQPRVNDLSARLATPERGIFGDIAGGFVTTTADKIKNWIIGSAGGSSGSGNIPAGPSPGGLTLGEAVARGGWPGHLARTAVGVAWEESSARADVANGQYRGLFQMGEAAAQDIGADYSRLFEPVYNSASAYKYYKHIGSWSPWEAYPPTEASMSRAGTAITGYKRGGWVPGRRDEPVPAILHGGELVIPTGGMERLNRGMASWRSGGGPGTARLAIDGSAGVERAIKHMEDRLDERLERQEKKMIDERAFLRMTLAAMGSPAGQRVHTRNNERAFGIELGRMG